MNRKKRLSILALVLCLVVAFTATLLVACDDNKNDDSSKTEITATEGLLISNSDFKVISTSGNYPRTITDWTGAKLHSSSNLANDIVAGAISLDKALYDANRKFWNDNGAADGNGNTLYSLLTAGRMLDSDVALNNVLMIYAPVEKFADGNGNYGPTAYGYTSATFNLDKGKYYKLSVDVLTYNIAGVLDKDGKPVEDNVPGARIYVSSSTYAEFSGIDTKGEWKTYDIYFEAAANSSSSLTVNLSLGKYTSSYDDGLTTGYAFFDNVTLTELTDEEGGLTAEQQYDKAVADELENNDALQTTTLKVPNGRFDYTSTAIGSVSTTAVPYNWTRKTGNSTGSDSAPTSAERKLGVIDVAQFASQYTSFASSYYLSDKTSFNPASYMDEIVSDIVLLPEGTVGTNVYMMSQQLMTSQGIHSSRQIVIEKNKFYALSVNVFTFNIFGAGVNLLLTGSGEDIVIEGISRNLLDATIAYGKDVTSSDYESATGKTTGGWVTYTFYIHGNQYRDMSYNMEFWLGTDGTSDNTEVKFDKYSSSGTATSTTTYKANGTFSTGWAFFDELKLDEIDAAAYEAVTVTPAYTADASGGETELKVDLATENLFTATDFNHGISGDFTVVQKLSNGYDNSTDGTPAGFKVYTDSEASAPVVSPDIVKAGVKTLPDTPYDTVSDKGIEIVASENTMFGYKTDSFAVPANSFYRISLWVKTVDVQSTSGIYAKLMQVKTDDEDDKELAAFSAVNTSEVKDYNGWTELTFVVRGSAEKAENLYLVITLGTGTKWTSSTLAKGTAYIGNMSLTKITYSDYNGSTAGTYLKKANLASEKSYGFTNGGFDNIDFEKMEEALSASENPDGTLQQSGKPGIPSGWTLDNKQPDDAATDNLVGGILELVYDDSSSAWKAGAQISSVFEGNADALSFFNTLYDGAPALANGAPNVLVLAGKNAGDSFVAGYTSDSFSLSASTCYTVSVWAKAQAGTKAMIFLQGEPGGNEISGLGLTRYFSFTGDGNWHQYTFNIQVGLSSVSLKLGLWLGENGDITGRTANTDNAASFKSSGIVVFDSVSKREMTDSDFEAVEINEDNKEYTRKISFNTDSFDPASDTAEDRSELTTPNGWTDTVGTDQERKNSKYGVLYADEEYLETDSDGYLTLFGPELKADDFTVTPEEIAEARKNNPDKYPESVDDSVVIADLKADKLAKAKADRMTTLAAILGNGNFDGKNILAINNTADSAFYYASSSYTLKAEKAYKISVRVRAYGIGHLNGTEFTATTTGGAYAELYLGTANESDSPMRIDGIGTVREGEWTTYTFYVLAPDTDVTGVKLRLGLGIYDANDESKLVSGYAFFDAVTVETITYNEFDQLYASQGDDADFDKTTGTAAIRILPEQSSQGDTGKDDEATAETPDNKFNLDNLWWMIPTILLAIAIIAVVIVFFVKKYRKKAEKASNDVVADASSQNNLSRKKNEYDDFNE